VGKKKKRVPKGRPWAGVFLWNGRLNAWNGEKKKPHKRTTGRWAPLGKENCPIIPTLIYMYGKCPRQRA